MAQAPAGTAHTLVLLRHGESTWNEENRFTGWYDCPLSSRGLQEALDGGAVLRDQEYVFDVAFTSLLKRAIKTLWVTLEQLDLMYIPIVHSWRLNERHYGGLQGLDKKETVAKHGKDQVLVWRRSYDIPPPPVSEDSEHFPANDVKYKAVPRAELPKCESLKDTEARVMVDWNTQILPQMTAGKRVLIAAHGNTLRALVKYLDNIPADEITELNIPTGIPLVYHLDANLRPIRNPDAIAPLSGAYLGNQEQIKARIMGVVNQTK
jgi:2,3-bisphosphoglycerate-dependent phosphoglycerate mutase